MKKNIMILLVSMITLSAVVSCGKPSQTTQNTTPVTPSTASPAAENQQATPTTPPVTAPTSPSTTGTTGSVSGTIRFVGAVPSLQKVNMAADPKCVANNTGNMLPEFLVVGEGQTLANVLVKISKGHEAITTSAPTNPVVLDQKGCQYFPHVIGVQKGQPVKVLNSDGTLHNVHIQAQANGEHNEAMPSFRKELEKTFTEVESAFPVKCDVHPWMKAYVEVLDHPFFMATKPDGHYSIANLPAGDYELTFWHEKLGQQTSQVTVVAGQDVQSHIDWQAPQGTTKLDAVLLTNWN